MDWKLITFGAILLTPVLIDDILAIISVIF